MMKTMKGWRSKRGSVAVFTKKREDELDENCIYPRSQMSLYMAVDIEIQFIESWRSLDNNYQECRPLKKGCEQAWLPYRFKAWR